MKRKDIVGARDFDRKTVNALKRKGVTFIGIQAYRVTYPNGSWGYETAYILNDNGVSRIRAYFEVIDLAKKG